jgi:hypothetical protein
MKTEDILNEREKTHGDFEEVGRVYQHLKLGLELSRNSVHLKSDFHAPQKSALEMICLKMARIVCGSHNHADHWDDIAGYAMLGKGNSSAKTNRLQTETN